MKVIRAVCRFESVGDQVRFVGMVERGDWELELVRDLADSRLAIGTGCNTKAFYPDEVVQIDGFVAVRMDLRVCVRRAHQQESSSTHLDATS